MDFKEAADETLAKVTGWRKSESLFSSTVAALVSAYVLDMRDRHDGNIGLSANRLAHIDFGWTKRRPDFDTGDFCLPTSLRELWKEDGQWSDVHDLCWDAIQVLRERKATICDAWMQALTMVSLCDRTLLETQTMVERLEISQEDLDARMDSKGNELVTTFKNDMMRKKEWFNRNLGRVWQAAGDVAVGLTRARPMRQLSIYRQCSRARWRASGAKWSRRLSPAPRKPRRPWPTSSAG